jgi:nucleoside-diphosphate-sugar epimerase
LYERSYVTDGPAPLATVSGGTPRMKATDAIRIGRRRVRPAAAAASSGIAGVRRAVFASSVAAYGETRATRSPRTRPPAGSRHRQSRRSTAPRSCSPKSLGRIYQQKLGVEFNALRVSSVYGKRFSPVDFCVRGLVAPWAAILADYARS